MFDVIPISEAWGHADLKFAMTYWPWSSLLGRRRRFRKNISRLRPARYLTTRLAEAHSTPK